MDTPQRRVIGGKIVNCVHSSTIFEHGYNENMLIISILMDYPIHINIISMEYHINIKQALSQESVPKKYFLISQPKHMLWVLKRTVSMRRFF